MRSGRVKKDSIHEERIKEIRSFIEMWLTYAKAFKRAFKGAEITREDENEFLKLKSNLARRHAILLEALQRDYIGGESIRPILSQTVTLSHVNRIRPEHYEKIERSWHETYIHLNETIGHLRYLLDEGK
jgi:hypothetical protein